MRNPLSQNFTNKLQHLFDQTGHSVLSEVIIPR